MQSFSAFSFMVFEMATIFFGNTAALKAGKRERNKAFIRKAKAFPEALQLTSGYINISLTTLTARKS